MSRIRLELPQLRAKIVAAPNYSSTSEAYAALAGREEEVCLACAPSKGQKIFVKGELLLIVDVIHVAGEGCDKSDGDWMPGALQVFVAPPDAPLQI